MADYVCREEECELIGLDLGYAVNGAFRHFGKNAFFHVVQASVFAPPFATATFDFVYSFGVIHHTFSTKTAFDSLAQLAKKGGRAYIWVYSPFDESRNLLRRSLMVLENIIRPVLWRMPEKAQTVALAPIVPAYMAMQWLRSKRSDGSVVAYGFREGLHAARDRFTPPFVHRHTEDEVSSWFQAAGFRDLTSRAVVRNLTSSPLVWSPARALAAPVIRPNTQVIDHVNQDRNGARSGRRIEGPKSLRSRQRLDRTVNEPMRDIVELLATHARQFGDSLCIELFSRRIKSQSLTWAQVYAAAGRAAATLQEQGCTATTYWCWWVRITSTSTLSG